jgi:hypothetical protein
MNNLFAHAISRIDFLDGMVRLELAIATPAGEPGKNGDAVSKETEMQPVSALHMPLGGFMRSAVVQEAFIRELVSRGILPSPQAAGTAAAPAPAAPKAEGSPNFR